MNLNPVFSQGWTNGQIPPGWQDWATGHNNGDNKRAATAGEVEDGFARGSYTSVAARISAEELARTTENAAMAVKQSLTEARLVTLPNLLKNSDFSLGKRYWSGEGSTGYDPIVGALGAIGGSAPGYLISDLIPVHPASQLTGSFNGSAANPGGSWFYISQYDAAGNYMPAGDGLGLVTFENVSWSVRKSTTFTTRADCHFIKVVVYKPAGDTPLYVSRIMLNSGSTAVGWTDAATTRDLAARTAASEGSIAEQSGKLQAWAQRTVQAGDGKVFVEMRAIDNNGNITADILMGARRIGLLNEVDGGYLPALEAEGTRVKFAAPLSIIRGGRRTTLGPGFGAGNDLHLWSGPSSIGYGGETIDNGILGISATDGFFGGKTLSGPFDTGVNGATINLPKNTWTTVASVDRGMQTAGYLMARASLSVLLGQANNDGDFTVQYRIAVTDPNGSNVVNIGGNFGSFAPNAWQTITGSLIEGAVNLASRGNKKVVLQINPTGSSIGSAQARNCQARGLYGA